MRNCKLPSLPHWCTGYNFLPAWRGDQEYISKMYLGIFGPPSLTRALSIFLFFPLSGNCTPNQNWACLALSKIINTVLKNIKASWSKLSEKLKNVIKILVGQVVLELLNKTCSLLVWGYCSPSKEHSRYLLQCRWIARFNLTRLLHLFICKFTVWTTDASLTVKVTHWRICPCINLTSIGPPNSTTCKGPDNHGGEGVTFGVLPSQNHPLSKSKTPYFCLLCGQLIWVDMSWMRITSSTKNLSVF